MAVTRRTMLTALPAMAGLSTLTPGAAAAQASPDPLGVRMDFPVASAVLSLNAAYIAPTPLPITRVGVDRIETHTVALAHRLQRGLRTMGFEVLTPEGNRSSIVAFRVTKAADAIATHLANTKTSVSVRENGTQIRVSPALFNTDADIDRFLTVAEGLR